MSPDSSATIQNGVAARTVLTFFNTLELQVDQPIWPTPAYRLMDQFFNAERNDGVFTIDTAGNIQAIAPGTQALQVDFAGLPSYHLAVTVTANGGGSGPAVRFVVTIELV